MRIWNLSVFVFLLSIKAPAAVAKDQNAERSSCFLLWETQKMDRLAEGVIGAHMAVIKKFLVREGALPGQLAATELSPAFTARLSDARHDLSGMKGAPQQLVLLLNDPALLLDDRRAALRLLFYVSFDDPDAADFIANALYEQLDMVSETANEDFANSLRDHGFVGLANYSPSLKDAKKNSTLNVLTDEQVIYLESLQVLLALDAARAGMDDRRFDSLFPMAPEESYSDERALQTFMQTWRFQVDNPYILAAEMAQVLPNWAGVFDGTPPPKILFANRFFSSVLQAGLQYGGQAFIDLMVKDVQKAPVLAGSEVSQKKMALLFLVCQALNKALYSQELTARTLRKLDFSKLRQQIDLSLKQFGDHIIVRYSGSGDEVFSGIKAVVTTMLNTLALIDFDSFRDGFKKNLSKKVGLSSESDLFFANTYLAVLNEEYRRRSLAGIKPAPINAEAESFVLYAVDLAQHFKRAPSLWRAHLTEMLLYSECFTLTHSDAYKNLLTVIKRQPTFSPEMRAIAASYLERMP